MNISNSGLQFIKDVEGSRHSMYKCAAGHPTIGVGHLIKPTEAHLLTARLTEDEITLLLKADLEEREAHLNNFIYKFDLKLTQFEYDALISFIFNVGITAFDKSTLAKKLSQGFTDEAGKEFDKWTKPIAIISRRMAEKNIFLTHGMFGDILIDKRMNNKQINIMAEYVTRYLMNANNEGLFNLR